MTKSCAQTDNSNNATLIPSSSTVDDIQISVDMHKDSQVCRITARIELGVAGYLHSVENFSATTFTGLKEKILNRLNTFADELMNAQCQHGDLRGYSPEFANGYPTFFGEPELGEDFSVSVLELRMNGTELDYHSKYALILRRDLGIC